VDAIREYFKKDPYTLFSATHEQRPLWKTKGVSDVVYIVSKAAMDRLTDSSFVTWLDTQIKERGILFYYTILELILQISITKLTFLQNGSFVNGFVIKDCLSNLRLQIGHVVFGE
jgi:hypothetical protein